MSRVAVVTGGASGIGLGVAQQLAADGHAVAILDRNGAAADAAAAELRGRRRHRARGRGRRRRSRLGRRRVRAGPRRARVRSRSSSRARASSRSTPSLDITAEKWDRIIAVNLTGTFTCVQAALPDMLAAGWGRIVTIASSSAQSGAPNMAHYAASKGGVISLTKALAVELARQRHHRQHHHAEPRRHADVPARPKPTATSPASTWSAPMVPLGRAGTPADIAAACSFLCSEGGSYITGQVIGVNGGMYI